MNFFQDPLAQFFINASIALAALILSAASFLMQLQSLPVRQKNQGIRQPNTGPLAREKTAQGCIIPSLGIIACLFGMLYCSLQILSTIFNPYPFSRLTIIFFTLIGLGCIYIIATTTTRLLQGEPRIPPLPEEQEEDSLTDER